jgi:hypothetical protein
LPRPRSERTSHSNTTHATNKKSRRKESLAIEPIASFEKHTHKQPKCKKNSRKKQSCLFIIIEKE